MSKASQNFDPHQFAGKGAHPVSARMTVDGWLTPGVSYDDYSRMSTQRRKTTGERRLPTPVWAVNNPLLRRVLVTFMEERAGFRKGPRRGGLKERLEHAKAKIISKRPKMIDVLDKLCREYVEIKNKGLNPDITDAEWNASKPQPYMAFAEGEARYIDEKERRRQLEIEIEGIDTYLRYTANGGADVVAAIVYLYYRTGLDSVGVGEELGLKPPHVRQTLWRLHRTAKAMEASQLLETSAAATKRAKDAAKKSANNRFTTPSLF